MRVGLTKSRAVGRVGEIFVDRLLERARADSMHDSHLGAVSQVGLIEKLLQPPERVRGTHPNKIKFTVPPAVGACPDAHCHLRQPARGPLALRAAEPLRGDLDAQSAAAHDRSSRLERDELSLDIAELDPVANLERLARRTAFDLASVRRHLLDPLCRPPERRTQLALRLASCP